MSYKRISPDLIRSKSLLKASGQALQSARLLPFEETTHKTIFRELYEGLHQCCEAIGYGRGYKFSSHESITLFLRDVLKEPNLAKKFDRFRELRNRINYYGHDIAPETVREAMEEIPSVIATLSKYLPAE